MSLLLTLPRRPPPKLLHIFCAEDEEGRWWAMSGGGLKP